MKLGGNEDMKRQGKLIKDVGKAKPKKVSEGIALKIWAELRQSLRDSS